MHVGAPDAPRLPGRFEGSGFVIEGSAEGSSPSQGRTLLTDADGGGGKNMRQNLNSLKGDKKL